MKAQEILELVNVISAGKRIEPEQVFEAAEAALAEAVCKNLEEGGQPDCDARVSIDRDSGEYVAFRIWRVLPDDYEYDEDGEEDEEIGEFNAERHLRYAQAEEQGLGLEVGQYREERLENLKFGRIAAQQARYVMNRRVRDAERAQILLEYRDRIGELISGQIDRRVRDGYIVTIKDNVEALLPHNQVVGEERFFPGDTVRGVLDQLDDQSYGRHPQLLLSRSSERMLRELFKLEVPEVAEQVIEIYAVAREPGSRAKIAVKTNDGRIDPVGVCVGMRGARVQAVTSELNGERIDVILWDNNPERMAKNALLPAQVSSVYLDEVANSVEVAVPDENLATAVGIRGENVRLASVLIGRDIQILGLEEADQRRQEKERQRAVVLARQMDIDEALADKLVASGMISATDIFEQDSGVLAGAGVPMDKVEELKEKAGNVVMVEMMGGGEEAVDAGLLALEGMNQELGAALTKAGIGTVEALAEQAIDDLIEIEGMTEELAGALILAARAPWFESEVSSTTDQK